MLIVMPVSSGVVPYFTDGRHPGRWSDGATRLLGLEGPVEPSSLRSVLEGCDPATGRYLPGRRPHRRRGGWDLVFGAPKSISLLGASNGPEQAGSVAEAHVEAAAGVARFIEERLVLQRSGPDGRPCRAEGLVAAAFHHTVNAADEPHLHTHLVVANLTRSGGAWGAVQGGEWFVGRAALAALYQLELRQQLERRGWRLDWRLGPDGLADLAAVPRVAVRAASRQGRAAVYAGSFSGRLAGRRSPGSPGSTGSPGSPGSRPWEQRVAEAGGSLPALAGPGNDAVVAPPSLDDPKLARAVAIRLAGRRSDFRAEDVIVALATCHPGGASTGEAAAWAERFCGRCQPVRSPTAGPRWTTEGARRSDQEVRRLLERRVGEPVPQPVVEGAMDRLTARGVGPGDGAGGAARGMQTVRELTAAAGVHFLGAPAGRTDLLAQAEVLLACREVWEAAGRRVAVASPTPEAARRWQVLAGLAPYRPGDRVDVLVVDQADRRTSADLARLARGCGGQMVFVEGGTMPRLTNPASHGLADLAEEVGRHSCPPHQPWAMPRSPDSPGADRLPPGGELVGRAAAADLLARWQAAVDAPLLVALGLEEVRELNRAARETRQGVGSSGFAAGDRVVVLGRRAGLPGYGSFGTVTEAPLPDSRRQGDVAIAWDAGGRTRTSDRWALGAVGYGYAVTPAVAARTGGPLMVLGPASSLGRGRDRVVAETGLRPEDARRERRAGLEVGR